MVDFLISEHVFLELKDSTTFMIRRIDRVKVKGKSEPIWIFEVFDADPPEIKNIKAQTLENFEAGLMLYDRQKFKNALQVFQECLAKNPKDNAAKIYINRCQKLLNTTNISDFDGITKLDTK